MANHITETPGGQAPMGRRIAIVCDRPFDPARGGVERVSETLKCALRSKGYEVYFYSLTPQDPSATYDDFTHSAPNADPTSQEVLFDYQDFLRSRSIDTVVVQDGQSDTIALTLATGNPNIRLIVCIHSTPLWDYTCLWRSRLSSLRLNSFSRWRKYLSRAIFFIHHKHRALRLWKKRYRMIAESGAELILLSERFYDSLALTGIDFGNRLHAIPNINTYPEPVAVDWSSKMPEILYVGRLSNYEKQLSLLLRIWQRVAPQAPEWALTIVGSGPDEEYLKQFSRRLKLPRVRFVGRCDPTPYYRRASIFCMTSLFEGFPMVLTEAQQQGTAVIAFDSFAAVRDIIEDGVNGMLVTPFKKREYAEKLLHLMRDDEYRLRLARRARETVQRFNADIILPQWLTYLGCADETDESPSRPDNTEELRKR